MTSQTTTRTKAEQDEALRLLNEAWSYYSPEPRDEAQAEEPADYLPFAAAA